MNQSDAVLASALKELVGAIAYQAVFDWKELKYGETEVEFSLGQNVFRREVRAFLLSPTFEAFVDYSSPNIDMDAVKEKLKLTEEIKTGIEGLTPAERETIISMANNGMNVPRIAKNAYTSKSRIYERLKMIRDKTGIDPTDFYGLNELLRLMGEKESEEREQEQK